MKDDKSYIMFLKDESLLPIAKKNIRIATSINLTSNYAHASEPISISWVEGPTTIKANNERFVYFDVY